ncbi:hypothetical protein B0H19DRAFT_1380624 [Mycena capillaripes]|nr:hypothetical protein B0H19DRAFT_1380624 [Mycena capillaripes]
MHAISSLAGNFMDELVQKELDKIKIDFESALNKALGKMKVKWESTLENEKPLLDQLKMEGESADRTLKEALNELQEMSMAREEERLEDEDVLEAREAVALCLNGFNDIIFAAKHFITVHGRIVTDTTLYVHGLEHITHLLDPENAPHYNPAVETARLRALSVLPEAELRLCEALATGLYNIATTRYVSYSNTILQHPAVLHSRRPDRATALRRVLEVIDETHLPTLEKFLASDPKRIRDGDTTENPLFALDGTYTSVLEKRRKFEEKKAEWMKYS